MLSGGRTQAGTTRRGHPAGHVVRQPDTRRVSDVPELAVLSALAHPETEVALAALAAISGLPEDQARLYFDVIMAALTPHDRKTLEARMKGYVYQSEFARK